MREALTFETNNKYFVLFDVQAYLVGHGFELFQKLVSENGNFIVISNCPPIFNHRVKGGRMKFEVMKNELTFIKDL